MYAVLIRLVFLIRLLLNLIVLVVLVFIPLVDKIVGEVVVRVLILLVFSFV